MKITKGSLRIGEFGTHDIFVKRMKEQCAHLVDEIEVIAKAKNQNYDFSKGSSQTVGEVFRLCELAQTKIEEGCMLAVKAYHISKEDYE